MMSPQETNALPKFAYPVKILVCGGRNYNNREFMWGWLDSFFNANNVSHVITGGAQGADAIGSAWAAERGIQQVIVPANWRVHGPAAGPLRNMAMADLKPNLVVAFPGGKGTSSMIRAAQAAQIQVIELAPLFKESA